MHTYTHTHAHFHRRPKKKEIPPWQRHKPNVNPAPCVVVGPPPPLPLSASPLSLRRSDVTVFFEQPPHPIPPHHPPSRIAQDNCASAESHAPRRLATLRSAARLAPPNKPATAATCCRSCRSCVRLAAHNSQPLRTAHLVARRSPVAVALSRTCVCARVCTQPLVRAYTNNNNTECERTRHTRARARVTANNSMS